MKIYYEAKCPMCRQTLKTRSDSVEYIIWVALMQGWALQYCDLICPDCMEDNYNHEALFGIRNENVEQVEGIKEVE